MPATCVRSRRCPLGFTVIELLVVVAVVGLAMATLPVSVASARRQAKQATCREHMHTLAQTALIYADMDANGFGLPVLAQFFPPEQGGIQSSNDLNYLGAYTYGGKSGIGQPSAPHGYIHPTNPNDDFQKSKYGTKARRGPNQRPFNKILYPAGFPTCTFQGQERWTEALGLAHTKLDLKEFECPADDGAPDGGHCYTWVDWAPENRSYDHFGTSYAANIFMTYASWGSLDQIYMAMPIYSNSPFLRPMSRVPNPARTMLFEDNIGRWAWACKRDPCPYGDAGIDPGPTKVIRSWHGRDWAYMQSYCDGHADMARIVMGEEDGQGYRQHYRIERFTEQIEGRDPAAFMCITVRGPGWQKDTLPAPRVVTHFNSHGFGGADRVSYEDCVGD